MKKTGAAIIGAGIGGIATAIRLRLQGLEVDVFEANPQPGGKLNRFEQRGYQFDAGPSLFTLPHLVDELFNAAGKDPRAYFRYKKKEVVCQYFYEDGTRLTAYAAISKFAREVAEKLGTKADLIEQYLRKSAYKYEVTKPIFLENSLNTLKTYTNGKAVRALVNLPFMDSMKTLHQTNAAMFDDPRLVQLFDRFATYNGSDPYQTPGMMSMIPHLEHGIGTYIPEGGMYAIVTALTQLAEEMGVRWHCGEPVTQIHHEGSRATGISTTKRQLQADLVVSNSDINFVYGKLLKGVPMPEATLKQEKSSSALIFYWGIRHSFPELDLHNIFFSKDYEAEFRKIFREKTVGDDPTIYINITSKDCPEDAPQGCENWFVMVNVPANTGQDWDLLTQQIRQDVLAKLSRMLGQEIAPLIEAEQILSPISIEQQTRSHLGALYGSSSNNRFSAFLRHANRSRHLKNLYFTGGSVHPGGGIPLCLFSAKIVSQMVARQA